MDKKTTTIIAVGALAAVGYLVWKQSQKKSFSNLVAGPTTFTIVNKCNRMVSNDKVKYMGSFYYNCCGQGVLGLLPGDVGCNTQQSAV